MIKFYSKINNNNTNDKYYFKIIDFLYVQNFFIKLFYSSILLFGGLYYYANKKIQNNKYLLPKEYFVESDYHKCKDKIINKISTNIDYTKNIEKLKNQQIKDHKGYYIILENVFLYRPYIQRVNIYKKDIPQINSIKDIMITFYSDIAYIDMERYLIFHNKNKKILQFNLVFLLNIVI